MGGSPRIAPGRQSPMGGESRPGWRSSLELVGHLVWQGYAGQHLALACLTAIAIGACVALAVSLEVASRSIRTELRGTAQAISGRSDLRVGGWGSAIPESLLDEIRRIDGVASAEPVARHRFRIATDPMAGEPLEVIGVDLLAERPIHDYAFDSSRLVTPDPLRLIAEPEALIVTGAFRERTGVAIGDEIRVRAPAGDRTLVVRGVLESSGLARAYAGQIAIMDVFALQDLVGPPGFLQLIAVDVAPDADPARVREAIEERTRGVASVAPEGGESGGLERSLEVVQLGVAVVVAMGMGVALMLAYGTAALSTERRAAEFALLRVAGLEARRVRAIVVIDTLVMGAMATSVGFPLGVLLARPTTRAFSGIGALFARGEIEPAAPGWITLAAGLLVGLVVSGLGASLPARSASRKRPLDVLQRARLGATERLRPGGWVAFAILLLVGAAAPLPAIARAAWLAVAAVGLVRSGVRRWLPRLMGAASGALERALPGVGYLVGIAATARPLQASIAISAIAGLLGAVAAIAIVIASLARTVDDWMAGGFIGDATLRSTGPFAISAEVIQPETIERVLGVPGVLGVTRFTGLAVRYQGVDVGIISREYAAAARYERARGRRLLGEDELRGIAAGGAVATEPFLRSFGLHVGDQIALDTPQGGRSFPIVASRPNLDPTPSISLDREIFERYWPSPGVYQLRVWTDQPSGPVLDAIVRAVEDLQPLYPVDYANRSRWGSDLAARFDNLLHVVSALVAGIGGVALLNLLAGSVSERRRDLMLLHAAGASRLQLGAVVALDALAIAALGGLLGLATAFVLAGPLIGTVEEAYGWRLDRHIPWIEISIQCTSVIAIGSLAAMIPLRAALRRVRPELLAPE